MKYLLAHTTRHTKTALHNCTIFNNNLLSCEKTATYWKKNAVLNGETKKTGTAALNGLQKKIKWRKSKPKLAASNHSLFWGCLLSLSLSPLH